MTNANASFNFEHAYQESIQPLAARLRPNSLKEYIGQSHILAPNMPLTNAINSGQCHSLILWGPPGTGKTTLAEIIAKHANAAIERLSAVTSGIKEIRAAIDTAKNRIEQYQQRTILFVDEVHRFNKSQQDAFLPFIEDGTITFVGATTENPAFELNRAILSRARVYTLQKLSVEELTLVLDNAKRKVIEIDQTIEQISLEESAQQQLLIFADGDARRLLNLFENSLEIAKNEAGIVVVTATNIKQVAGNKIALYDKGGDAFYDLISAFHKSVRGSDPDAALYWYARILEGGGDALYVARRLLAIASEDIGNADPRALQVGVSAWDVFHRVGPKEGERAIAQATIYMALAPKSNAVYMAFGEAKALAKKTSHLDVPLHLKNATSSLTEELGHGASYRYAHNEPNAFAAGECYFPEEISETTFYQPTERGLEIKLKQKLDYLNELNRNSDDQRSK